jgi:hypothetical protein
MGRTSGPPKLAKTDRKKIKNDVGRDDSLEKEKGGVRKMANECCVDCGKNVLLIQPGIKCDACDFWHHCECEGVDEVYSFLVEHEKEMSLQWYCKKCIVTCGKMREMMMKMHQHQQRLEERVDEMAKTMGNKIVELAAAVNDISNGVGTENRDKEQENQRRVEEKVDALASVVKGQQKVEDMQLHDCMQQAIRLQRQEETEELEEIRKRRTNIIIHGLKESSNEEAEERKEEDEELIVNLMHSIKCDTVSVNSVVRLGKRPDEAGSDKPRPVRLTVASEEQKEAILNRAKNLRRVKGMEKVFIHQDQTPKQRKKRQELVKELRKENKRERKTC